MVEMIRTITSPLTKLFIPTRLCLTGRRLLSVSRNDLMRYVSFPDLDQAQGTVDALRDGDVVHVMGELLTCRVPRPEDGGEMIVWETSVDAILQMAGPTHFGIDMCAFIAPNFVVLDAVYVSPHKAPGDSKKLLEDLLKL